MNPEQLYITLHQTMAQHADAQRALAQQAYMKSSMPFWGIAKPQVDLIARSLFAAAPARTNSEYRAFLDYVFIHAQYREEWYAGLTYAKKCKAYINAENVDLYIKIIIRGQWWDIVDDVSSNLIGKALYKHADLHNQLLVWINHPCMWIRRTALLAQLKYKHDTDFDLQSKLITLVAHEKDFFIRKAIGWSLREYSKTNPDAVAKFIAQHQHLLAPLSIKEGLRIIQAKGLSTI